jgi:hypothetical protein
LDKPKRFATYEFIMMFVPVTDAHDYKHLLSLYEYPDNVSIEHFPPGIPASAKDVVLYERPGFLQGAQSFYLKYRIDKNEIESIYNHYSSGVQLIAKNKLSEFSLGVTGLIYEEMGYDSTQTDFDFFIIDSQSFEPGDWNHGYTYGIAVSREKLEVIYWSEEW